MSGAANQGAFGNPGMGQSSWGTGPNWGPGGGNQGNPGGRPWGNNGGPNDYFGLWSISRPLLIAATITGFIVWWPVGLALLFVAIWNKRVGRWAFGAHGGHQSGGGCGWAGPWSGWKSRCGGGGNSSRSSGNSAFDEYREQTLRRLEEEQRDFSGFLERLRFAKDKAEFDQFMADRRQSPPPSEPQHQPEN
jgi:Protein of unknown function (DUF2852)